jgi:hypothetical protein
MNRFILIPGNICLGWKPFMIGIRILGMQVYTRDGSQESSCLAGFYYDKDEGLLWDFLFIRLIIFWLERRRDRKGPVRYSAFEK